MADKIVLKAERREVIGKKVKLLRQDGKLPAVIYGHGIGSVPIILDLRETSRLLQAASGSTLLTIQLEGEEHAALVREVQRDVLKRTLTHLDFQALSLTETVRAMVFIALEGEAPAVELVEGILFTSLDEVEVESLPQDLPDRFTVDITGLEGIGDGIYVRDLILPPGVEVLTDPSELIVVVTAQAVVEEEEEEELLEGEELLDEDAEPEVIERGRAGEEDAEE